VQAHSGGFEPAQVRGLALGAATRRSAVGAGERICPSPQVVFVTDRFSRSHGGAMIDQLCGEIQNRLHQLLDEADKLRRALAELSSDGSAAALPAARRRRTARRRGRAVQSSSTSTGRAHRPRASGPEPEDSVPTAPTSSARQRQGRSGPSAAGTRARSGQTRSSVLAALSSGEAMTAGEVATATGLGRASVSTTLSKLAKTGDVTKAARGYQRTGG